MLVPVGKLMLPDGVWVMPVRLRLLVATRLLPAPPVPPCPPAPPMAELPWTWPPPRVMVPCSR